VHGHPVDQLVAVGKLLATELVFERQLGKSPLATKEKRLLKQQFQSSIVQSHF
jgi:hypothetical protein